MKNSKNNTPVPQKVKLVCDFGPLLAFFIMYRHAGLGPATGVLILGTVLALAIIYMLERRVAIMPLFSGIAVTVFGGITLLLQDEIYIKIKPTVINLLFAAILLIGWARGKPLLKYLFSDALQLDEKGWLILSMRWGVYFVFLAALNEFIWRSFSTDFWVSFKVFGMFTCTIVFTLCQIPLMKRHLIEDTENP